MRHLGLGLLIVCTVWAVCLPCAAADAPAKASVCGKVCEGCPCPPCGTCCCEECPCVSKSVFALLPFYSEEVTTTAKGVTKVTTFLMFIRIESKEPPPK